MNKVLVIAPHPDDEVLGCGGTMIKHVDAGDEVYVCIATKGMAPIATEQSVLISRHEAELCHKSIGVKETLFLDFPAVMIEKENRYEVNKKILDLIMTVNPDDVYIPHWGDMQRDHQIIAEAAMVALRPKYNNNVKRIYSYETLSETGWNAPSVQNEFIPNVFVDISKYLERKIKSLKFYKSQLAPFPDARSLGAIEALAKYRGAVMHMGAAEAFMLIREYK